MRSAPLKKTRKVGGSTSGCRSRRKAPAPEQHPQHRRAFTRTASPLTVRCGSPLVRREAVEVLGEDRDAFNALVSGSRAACAQAGLADALTEPPFGPHFTLAYCTTASDEETDRQLAAALSAACPTSIFTIDRISLVSVEQRRDEGIFAFDTLAEWELGVN